MAESARFANNASATLASSITDSGTTLTVTTGQGALFPSVNLGSYETFFYGTLVDTSGNIEIVKCTVHNGSSDSFTISRAQENTTARSFSAGDLFELRITAGGLTNIRSNWAATDGTGTGIEYITFDTSGTGACINTSSTGSTRKIITNTGTNSYYALGVSPYLQFKTNISFFDNTSAEPGTLCTTISSSGISTTGTVSTSVLSVTGNSTLGNGTSDTVTVAGDLLVGVVSATSNGGHIETSNGLTFPATQSACSNANTLDDYEEGTWTPADNSGASLSLTVTNCKYQKIGNRVTLSGTITYPSTANGSNTTITLPITASATTGNSVSIVTDAGVAIGVLILGSSSTSSLFLKNPTSAAAITNAQMSTKSIYVCISYEAA